MSLTPEQLELRRRGITGSDAPAIVGMSTRKTPADVWLDKKHPESIAAPNEKQLRKYHVAHQIENTISNLYAEDMKIARLIRPGTVPHPKELWLLATPDYLVADQKLGLELKNVSEWQKKEWGVPGTDLVPAECLIQCQHYMMVLGYSKWDVACLIGGHDFRIYHLYADKELQAMLYGAEKSFYKEFVLGDKEPKFDSGEQIRRYVLAKYPDHTKDKVIEVDPYGNADVKTAIRTLCGARRLFKQYKDQIDEQKTFLMNFMQDAEELQWKDESISITWKTPKKSIKINWQKIAERALETTSMTPEEVAALTKTYTGEKENTRRFVVKDESASDGEDDE